MIPHLEHTTEVIVVESDEPCLQPGSFVRRTTTFGRVHLVEDSRGTDIVTSCDHALADRSDPHMVALRALAPSS